MKRYLPHFLIFVAITAGENGNHRPPTRRPNVGARFSVTQSIPANQTIAESPSQLSTLSQQSQPTPDPKSPPPPANNKPKRKVLDADLSGFDISDNKSDKKVTTMLGGSRTAAIPSAILLAPKKAKFYGYHALFSWSFSGHNEGYVFLLRDEDETQWVRTVVKEPRYLAEPIFDKLESGVTYYWRVQVLPNPLASEPLEFVTVSSEERRVIYNALAAIPAGDSYDSGLARAQLFTDHRLWFDALGAYDDLIANYTNRRELYEQRAAIYAQVPATKSLSEADLARAEKAQ